MTKDKLKVHGGFAYKMLSPFMRLGFRIHYNPKIVNKEAIPKKGPIIIACNHKHVFDQCFTIMATKRVIHYMAKKEYFDGKFAWFFRIAGCIPVDRSIHDDKATNAALEILNKGGAIGIFPEGTRNKTYDTVLLPLKYGVVSMAYKTGATVVPCALTGDYKRRSKNLMVRYGTPFKVTSHDYEKFNKKLEKEMLSLMEENLKATNRTMEEELQSRNQDQKKKDK